MTVVLVLSGTGPLGAPTVRRLVADRFGVRVLAQQVAVLPLTQARAAATGNDVQRFMADLMGGAAQGNLS